MVLWLFNAFLVFRNFRFIVEYLLYIYFDTHVLMMRGGDDSRVKSLSWDAEGLEGLNVYIPYSLGPLFPSTIISDNHDVKWLIEYQLSTSENPCSFTPTHCRTTLI